MVFAGSLTYHLESAVNEVSVSDRLYRQAALVREPVEVNLRGGAGSFDHLSTAAVLAVTDKGCRQAKEGKGTTDNQIL